MTYLLDTPVVSELVRPEPNAGVTSWVEEQVEASLFLSVLTLGELAKGVARLPPSRRRERLASWLQQDIVARFEGRVLPVTAEVARRWGELDARALDAGTPLPAVDGLLAATALVHRLAVVTHNSRHFAPTGVEVVDPWR